MHMSVLKLCGCTLHVSLCICQYFGFVFTLQMALCIHQFYSFVCGTLLTPVL